MIKARHTLSGKWLSDFCSGPYMDRYFRKVNLVGSASGSEGLPLLILANHFSWWDGFIQYRLNRAKFGRKLYVMMLEEQLRKHMIMNKCGCFSIRKNSRDMMETIRYTIGLMSSPENMVLIFPQGKISSLHEKTAHFEPGTDYILKNIPNDYRIIFNVNLIDYGSYKKPELNIYFKTFAPCLSNSPLSLCQAYNDYYNECVKLQCR